MAYRSFLSLYHLVVSGSLMFKSSYTIRELADLLEWSKPRVRRWVKASGMKTTRCGNKQVVPIREFVGGDYSLLHSALHIAKLRNRA